MLLRSWYDGAVGCVRSGGMLSGRFEIGKAEIRVVSSSLSPGNEPFTAVTGVRQGLVFL